MAGPATVACSACHRQPAAAAAIIASSVQKRRKIAEYRAQHQRCRAERRQAPQLPNLPPAAGLLAAALLLAAPAPAAHAYNVRLEDVDSPTMQAGLRAATEGQLEEAERFFQIYLVEDPGSASAYSNLGNVHQQQGRPELAVEDYSKAVDLAPEAPVPYLNRAIAKESQGVAAAAGGDVSRAQALWRSALADCDAAIERDAKEFAAWFDRGNIRMRLEQWEDALTDFSTAADLAPGLPGYRLRHAALLFQNDDDAGAARMMQGIVRKNGNYAEAHVALAAVEWARGEGARAEEQLVRALQQDRSWADVRFVRQNTRWPPRLYEAYERFLAAPSAS
ncbi:hypothetical protein ABPG75_013392 [Micractinium tetrahymenae]